MIARLACIAVATACCLPAQLQLFVLQNNTETLVTSEYGFGTISLGDDRALPFRLRNAGSGPTPLTVFSLAGQGFSLLHDPLPQSVAAGDKIDFSIRFAPDASGFYSANFTADGVSAIVHGSVLAAAAVTVDTDGGPQVLMAGATIDFGKVVRGTTVSRRVTMTNQTSEKLAIQNMAIVGAMFQLKGPALPLILAPAGSVALEIDFTPAANGPQQGALEIEQRRIVLLGTAVDPPFPQPQIEIDIAAHRRSQQGNLKITLARASEATGQGEVNIEFQPAGAGVRADQAIQFLATGNRTATFQVNQQDIIGHFGPDDHVVFQTGTTAGSMIFTVKLGEFTAQVALAIAPEPVGVDSAKGQWTSAGLDLRIAAFDNTRSASKLSFTFFDQKGSILQPGTIVVDGSSAFQQYFSSSDLGGVFGLHGFFPVFGSSRLVDSVDIGLVNSAGTVQTGKIKFTP